MPRPCASAGAALCGRQQTAGEGRTSYRRPCGREMRGERGTGLGLQGRRPRMVLFARGARTTVRCRSEPIDGSRQPAQYRPKSAQAGVEGRPKWRPARRLLGLGPKMTQEHRLWLNFLAGRKGKVQHSMFYEVLIFLEAYMYDSLMNYV
jgi:hypothetical protein